jgi:hypothetical protein
MGRIGSKAQGGSAAPPGDANNLNGYAAHYELRKAFGTLIIHRARSARSTFVDFETRQLRIDNGPSAMTLATTYAAAASLGRLTELFFTRGFRSANSNPILPFSSFR